LCCFQQNGLFVRETEAISKRRVSNYTIIPEFKYR
jgi:hypothetical protein